MASEDNPMNAGASLDLATAYKNMTSMLNEDRVKAGQEYCKALMFLGFEPDILSWIYLVEQQEFQLAIVSSLVDRVGPHAIYDLLFKAYELSVTPKEIDPFIVSVYSPKMDLAVDLTKWINQTSARVATIPNPARTSGGWNLNVLGVAVPKLITEGLVIHVRQVKRTSIQDLTRWNRVVRRVEALAA